MEAYGQFAWKLRHYRGGPPASNHSSNGPVCRHLGGRLFCIPYYHSLSRFVLLSPPSSSLSRSSLCSLRRFHGEPRFRFQAFPPRASRQRKDLQITGKEYQRRISEVLSVGDRAGSCSTPEHPFLGPMGYIRPSAIDIIRLFRDNLPRIVRYRCFLLFFFFHDRIDFVRSTGENGGPLLPLIVEMGRSFRLGQICCITRKYGTVRNLFG